MSTKCMTRLICLTCNLAIRWQLWYNLYDHTSEQNLFLFLITDPNTAMCFKSKLNIYKVEVLDLDMQSSATKEHQAKMWKIQDIIGLSCTWKKVNFKMCAIPIRISSLLNFASDKTDWNNTWQKVSYYMNMLDSQLNIFPFIF